MAKKVAKPARKSARKSAGKKSTKKKAVAKKTSTKKKAKTPSTRTKKKASKATAKTSVKSTVKPAKKKADKTPVRKAKAAEKKTKKVKKAKKAKKTKKKATKKRIIQGEILNKPPPRKPNPFAGGLPRAADLQTGEEEKAKRRSGRVSSAITKQLAEIREMLIERRRDLRDGVNREFSEVRGRDLDHIGDESDVAAEAADSDLALRLAEKESLELAQIEDALNKIEDGTYGLCGKCGRTITTSRLRALPFATLCIECKKLQELERVEEEEFEFDTPE